MALPARRGKDKKERQQLFIKYVGECGTIYHACKKTQVARATVQHWMENPDFYRRVMNAKQKAIERLETNIYKKAMAGDSILAMFILKAEKPLKYRENVKINVDEEELNAAIERELAGLAGGSETPIVGAIEATPIVLDSTDAPAAD